MLKTMESREIATVAAGCFWCVEAVFEQLEGVVDACSGYMGGSTPKPSYEAVCSGQAGHAEVVQVTFDPQKILYHEILDWFWRLHDPTTRDRQGADIGTQYRSAIFFHSNDQETAAINSLREANASGNFSAPIVTEITPAGDFWPAEEDHQDFYRRNQAAHYCRAVITPKLRGLDL